MRPPLILVSVLPARVFRMSRRPSTLHADQRFIYAWLEVRMHPGCCCVGYRQVVLVGALHGSCEVASEGTMGVKRMPLRPVSLGQ